MKSAIVVMGPPASGKGTLCKALSDIGLSVIPPGEIYRKLLKENTALSNIIRESLKDGGYCPDELTNEIMLKESNKINSSTLIFDGYPRTQTQFDYLFSNWSVDLYLYITAPLFKLQEFSANRRICALCGATFSSISGINYPCCKNGAYYDKSCWSQRFDDTPEFYEKRYNKYMQSTAYLSEQAKSLCNYQEVEILDNGQAFLNLIDYIKSLESNKVSDMAPASKC